MDSHFRLPFHFSAIIKVIGSDNPRFKSLEDFWERLSSFKVSRLLFRFVDKKDISVCDKFITALIENPHINELIISLGAAHPEYCAGIDKLFRSNKRITISVNSYKDATSQDVMDFAGVMSKALADNCGPRELKFEERYSVFTQGVSTLIVKGMKNNTVVDALVLPPHDTVKDKHLVAMFDNNNTLSKLTLDYTNLAFNFIFNHHCVSSIEHFTVRGWDAGDGFVALMNILPWNVKHLTLGVISFENDVAYDFFIDLIASSKYLESLKFSVSHCSEHQFRVLTRLLARNTTITKLIVNECFGMQKIPSESATLFIVKQNKTLKYLSLCQRFFNVSTDSHLELSRVVMNHPSLTYFNNNSKPDQTFDIISHDSISLMNNTLPPPSPSEILPPPSPSKRLSPHSPSISPAKKVRTQ